MDPDENDPLLGRLAEQLAAYEDSLWSGEPVPDGGGAAEDLGSDSLARLRDAQTFLDLLNGFWNPGAVADSPTAAEPRRIGRFLAVRELGRGGHGVVYLAVDPALGRKVAIKISRPELLGSGERRRRFLREAHAAARLDHPNIVSVYEVGEAGPVIYIASHFCDGPSLADWLQRPAGATPLSPRAAAGLAACLADATEHAHRRGVLHRDIKPSNILLEPVPEGASCDQAVDFDGWRCVPRLADFGLAKLRDGDTEESLPGAVLGTPRSMAPEQAGGRNEEVGPPTDVHALGLVLYETLTGKSPFAGASDAETLRRVQEVEPVPPRRLRPAIPIDLESICLKCLEKSTGSRYPTASDLGEDVRRFLAGRPVRARAVGPWKRCLKWGERHPTAAIGLAAVSLALVVLAVAWRSYATQVRDARGLTELMRREAVSRGRDVRRLRYVADVREAHKYWLLGDPATASELLDAHRPARGVEDVRGFAWFYLDRLLRFERATLRGHHGEVYFSAFSPDGRTLATAGQDGTVRLWDMETSRPRPVVLRGHQGEVNCITYSADGRTMATASDDRSARLWDADTGHARATLRGFHAPVVSALLTPNGKLLATGERDGLVRLWDLNDLGENQPLGRQEGLLESMAFSPDGKTLAVACRREVALWDLETRRARVNLLGHARDVYGVAFSHDGRSVATTSVDLTIKLWDAESGRCKATFTGAGLEHSAAFSPDDRSLATAGDEKIIHVWDLASGTLRSEFKNHTDRVWCMAFSPDGRTLASASRDGTVRIWDPDARQVRTPLVLPVRLTASLAFSDHGETLTEAGVDGRVIRWDVATGRLRSAIPSDPGFRFHAVRLSPNGELVATATEDGSVTIQEVRSGRVRPGLAGRGPGLPIDVLEFFPDGSRLVFPGTVNTITIWDTATGYEAGRLSTRRDAPISVLAVSPRGDAIVSNNYREIEVWDLKAGRYQSSKTPAANESLRIAAIAFLADGRSLVLGAHGKRVLVWDTRSPSLERELRGHKGYVTALAVSPDGVTLATGGDDQMVKLWDLASGQETLTLEGHTGPVRLLKFSGDGQTLASAGEGEDKAREVFLWLSTGPMLVGSESPNFNR